MTTLDKKCVLNTLFRLGYQYYAYCNGTIKFFRHQNEAELYVRNMKHLSVRMDQNFNDVSFYAKKFSDNDAPEIYDHQVRIILS